MKLLELMMIILQQTNLSSIKRKILMIENEKRTVWVVSYYDYNNLPVVTVFSNKDAASLYYNYELKKNKHEKIDID